MGWIQDAPPPQSLPSWMVNQDGMNGTRQALKPLQVLEHDSLTEAERCQLYRDGFNVCIADEEWHRNFGPKVSQRHIYAR